MKGRSLTVYFRDTYFDAFTFTICSLSSAQNHNGSFAFNGKTTTIERIHFPTRWCALRCLSLKLSVHVEFARWHSRHVSRTHSLRETSERLRAPSYSLVFCDGIWCNSRFCTRILSWFVISRSASVSPIRFPGTPIHIRMSEPASGHFDWTLERRWNSLQSFSNIVLRC